VVVTFGALHQPQAGIPVYVIRPSDLRDPLDRSRVGRLLLEGLWEEEVA
jgi:hypothetical protein